MRRIPYIETLGDYWGDLCGSPGVAARWADELIGLCRMSFNPDPNVGGYFHGATVCLSALQAAGRHQELLNLLAIDPRTIHYRQYGVRALAALGRPADAVRYAEDGRGLNDSPSPSPAWVRTFCSRRGRGVSLRLIGNQAATCATSCSSHLMPES